MPDPEPVERARPSARPPTHLDTGALHRLAAVTFLGFASGLPLALTGQAMQAWLSLEGIDLATIGFLSLVGLPYTFKFLWAPLMDRFELPWLGRRRGWLVLTQLALAAALWWLAGTSPVQATRAFALLALLVAFVAASQDVVIDAYRTDLLATRERGLGSSLSVLGYRLAMILSGGVALIWVDPSNASGPGGWTWPEVYRFMAALMAGASVLSAVVLPPVYAVGDRSSVARQDLLGFLALLVAVAVGFVVSERFGPPMARALLAPWFDGSTLDSGLKGKWTDLLALLLGLGFTLPLATWAARAAKFQTLIGGLNSYFAQRGAAAFLIFIVLYKLGDAFAGSLMTPFLLKSMAFGPAEVGVVNKLIGLWLTIGGALLGGLLMLKLGLWRALLLFGALQMLSNIGFWWLAVNGKGALPGFVLPPFDWGFVKLAQPTDIDGGLLMVIAAENLSGGMGTAAFVAFLMSLCNQRFTATQYALLSAFASVGRVWVGPLAGVLSEAIGWPTFFIVSTVLALPALGMLWWLRDAVRELEADPNAPSADD
ncbi:MAG: AmpG family muropeptide MFS transporter [Rhizobacter sp.]